MDGQICSRGEYRGYTVWWSDPSEGDANDGEVAVSLGTSEDEAPMTRAGAATSEAQAMTVGKRFIDQKEGGTEEGEEEDDDESD